MVEQGWGAEFGQWVGSFERCTCTGSRGVTVGHLPLLLQPKGWLSLMSGWGGEGSLVAAMLPSYLIQRPKGPVHKCTLTSFPLRHGKHAANI